MTGLLHGMAALIQLALAPWIRAFVVPLFVAAVIVGVCNDYERGYDRHRQKCERPWSPPRSFKEHATDVIRDGVRDGVSDGIRDLFTRDKPENDE